MKALTADQRKQFAMTSQERQLEATAGAGRISQETKSAMVEFLGQTQIEGWRDNPYIPEGTQWTTDFKDGSPDRYYNKSGVSFGNGVDAGQHSREEFLAAGVEPYVVDKLSMHGGFGNQDMAAQASLGSFQRTAAGITRQESIHISNRMTAQTERTMRNKMPEGRYDSMTSAQQGAVMSLAHLYGPSFYSHSAFDQAVEGRWGDLYQNMQNYSSKTTMHNTRNRFVAETIKPDGQVAQL